MKKLSNILAVLLYVFIPVVVFILITAKSPIIGNIRSFVVMSGSMEPKLPVASLIFTSKEKNYQKGEIIAFNKGDEVVTHRIVETSKVNGVDYFITRGDANNVNDENPTPVTQVIGKEFFIVPFIGRFIIFVRTVPGFLIFVILPGLIFIGYEVKGIGNEMQKDIEKKLKSRLKLKQK